MLSIRHYDIAPEGFLENEPEDGNFHRAYQAARISGFEYGYYAVYRCEQRISVVPYFTMDFRLNTMLPNGFLKRIIGGLRFKIVCVGHPYLDGQIDGESSSDVLKMVNQELGVKCSIIAYKGFNKDLPLEGFIRVSGLPNAVLTLKGDYWAQLHHSSRKTLKKKLKQASSLRVEELDSITLVQAEQLYALYMNTYKRAATKFECLNVDYFLKTAPVSKYALYYEGEHLVAFVQLSKKKPRLCARYGGIDYVRGKHYGVYFVLALKAIEIAQRDGFEQVDLGASSYAYKRLLGCEMVETWNYYRHSNPIAHWILGKAKFVLEPSAKELA